MSEIATDTTPGLEFDEALQAAAERIIALALAEDTGADPDDELADYVAGDVTSTALVPGTLAGRAEIIAKAEGVIAGLPAAEMVFAEVDPACRFHAKVADGTTVRKRAVVAEIFGPYRSLLVAERTALNLMQRLSGIATLTRRFVTAVSGTRAEIFDTRKTAPGLRLLDKYAVRAGGGRNHRTGLWDMLLIKDNHVVACGDKPAEAVHRARAAGLRLPIEVEVTTLEDFVEALEVNPDFILLDNMSIEQMAEAVRRRDAKFTKACGPQLEASGGVTLDNVAAVALSGVERISVGQLTHSAAALDISMEVELIPQ
jgi:nicotinate-nucleotide pyrophosphorylase (carboxylating)